MLSVYHHTHWDREWYWTFRQYQLRLTQILPEIIDRLSSGALPCFTLDGQTAALEDALELLPGEASRLKGLIDSERLTVGPWFVMPDEWLVSGESLIRNLQRGIQSAKTWGCESFTGYLPDTFGHSGDIPTLLNGFGIDSAIVWRGVNPETSEFWWTSPSGAKVLTLHLTDGYFQNFFHDPGLCLEDRQKAVKGWIERGLEKSALGHYLLPVGGDHLGPLTEDALKALNTTLEKGWGKAVAVTTPDRFMADFLAQPTETLEPLPQIHGELLDCSGAFLLPGVWSARLWLKQQNRRAEHGLLHVLEPLMAITQHQTGHMILSEQLALETAWKTLLLNHPHDSICGCSIDEVHRENEVRFDTVFSLSNHLIQQQKARLQRLTKPTPNNGGECLWAAQIIHTGEQPYTGVIPFTALSQLTDSTQAESATDKEKARSK